MTTQQLASQELADTHGMEQWHDTELDFSALVAELGDGVTSSGKLGRMATRHTLWPSRGTRGVEHQAWVFSCHLNRRGQRLAR